MSSVTRFTGSRESARYFASWTDIRTSGRAIIFMSDE